MQGQACMALRWALFAEKYSLPHLAATCERFIMLHFNDVALSPEIAQVHYKYTLLSIPKSNRQPGISSALLWKVRCELRADGACGHVVELCQML